MSPHAKHHSAADAARPGVVVARFRRDYLVREDNGDAHRCIAGRRDLRPIAGDGVEFVPAGPDRRAHITTVLARSSCLERIDSRGRRESLAANVTCLVVVVAPRPTADLLTADRFVCAAELMRLDALVVCNKRDLMDAGDDLGPALDDYRRIGYRVLTTSAVSGEGIDELAAALQGHRSSFVGQSGVGKSSLINRLAPDAEQAVEALSRRSGEGRHTTTTAVLHTLPAGGEVIDSPGVRGYSPPLPASPVVQRGYRELLALADGCRFGDCLHRDEPGCAVKTALEDGLITSRRYESYISMLQLSERLDDPRAGTGARTRDRR